MNNQVSRSVVILAFGLLACEPSFADNSGLIAPLLAESLFTEDARWLLAFFGAAGVFAIAVLLQVSRLCSATVDRFFLEIHAAICRSLLLRAVVVLTGVYVALMVLSIVGRVSPGELTDRDGDYLAVLLTLVPATHIALDWAIVVLFARARATTVLALRATLGSIALVMFFSVFSALIYGPLSLMAWGKSQHREESETLCIT